MALTDLWASSPDQVRNKHVQQIIAFAGDGKLLDGKDASAEFRDFLLHVPSSYLARYAAECLIDSFPQSGYALQDIINEVGSRLGFSVTCGRYQGTITQVGFDGLWRSPDGHSIIVEVKTTDAYRIALDKLANYRRALTSSGNISENASSILVVVGRQDTGDLEAQIRGSRHAWDVRLISIDALLRLLAVKEEVEDPKIVRRIHVILIPREFTRLDEIVDVLFSTAENIKQEAIPEGVEEEEVDEQNTKLTPMAFHDACVARIESHLGNTLVKRARATFSSPHASLALICAVSKEHGGGDRPSYWFAFHPHQKEFLKSIESAYVAFGCGSAEQVLLIPFRDFVPLLNGMNITRHEDRFYWHVSIFKEGERFVLHRRRGETRADLTGYFLNDGFREGRVHSI